MRDISDYYVGPLVAAEEKAWAAAKFYVPYRNAIALAVASCGGERVLEVGCGTGFVPAGLSNNIDYLGLDRNDSFLALARGKNAGRANVRFHNLDVRLLTPAWLNAANFKPDVVASFAFFKHFGLGEWERVFATVVASAPTAVFEVSLSDVDHDNGVDFHHTFVTPGKVYRVLASLGHVVRRAAMTFAGTNSSGRPHQDWIVSTAKLVTPVEGPLPG